MQAFSNAHFFYWVGIFDRESLAAAGPREFSIADKICCMSLIQILPPGPLDIIGDIHGEIDALQALIAHLGYDSNGLHPEGRKLVFVGDFCDRGPDSPAVLNVAQRLVQSGRALAVLGNHEINLLREDAKDGSGWYFDERVGRDQDKYAPFARPDAAQRGEIAEFLSRLPIALERDDLRIVHAAWQGPQIAAARMMQMGSVRDAYDRLEDAAEHFANECGISQRVRVDEQLWLHDLEDGLRKPPFLQAQADNEFNKQMFNPLKVLTSGVEAIGRAPFYAGGKWRFVERVAWWSDYVDDTPVVMGHYWRRVHPVDRSKLGKNDPDIFSGIAPFAWHGQKGNVFCVDFSVGARWSARKQGRVPETDFKLAALRWPERTLQFDDGSVHATSGFLQSQAMTAVTAIVPGAQPENSIAG